MIPYNFDYYRPDSINEAVQIYQQLDSEGKNPLYYSGGSEIISMARVNNITTKAVIDLKAIPECGVFENSGNDLIIGAGITLSGIKEANVFPLLSKACGRIADHTMQCKITIGGNACGTIIYKETLLPLLLSDCNVVVVGSGKVKQLSIHNVFHEKLNLSKGDFIAQFIIEKKYLSLPYFHVKKTKNEKIDYPLLTLCAVVDEGKLKAAFSGLCDFPFRSIKLEDELNKRDKSFEERFGNAVDHIPVPVLNDLSGSDQYRLFVLKNTLLNAEKELG